MMAKKNEAKEAEEQVAPEVKPDANPTAKRGEAKQPGPTAVTQPPVRAKVDDPQPEAEVLPDPNPSTPRPDPQPGPKLAEAPTAESICPTDEAVKQPAGQAPVAVDPATMRRLVIGSDGKKLYYLLNQLTVFECHDVARQLATVEVR